MVYGTAFWDSQLCLYNRSLVCLWKQYVVVEEEVSVFGTAIFGIITWNQNQWSRAAILVSLPVIGPMLLDLTLSSLQKLVSLQWRSITSFPLLCPPPSSVHPSIHILTLFLWSSLLSVLSSYSTAYYFKPSDLTSITTFIALPASNQKYWPFHLMICEATYTILSDTVY